MFFYAGIIIPILLMSLLGLKGRVEVEFFLCAKEHFGEWVTCFFGAPLDLPVPFLLPGPCPYPGPGLTLTMGFPAFDRDLPCPLCLPEQ